MHYYGWWGGGGWWIAWWLVWIIIIVGVFSWWTPNRRPVRVTPLEVLQHRLANGDITPEEYERRHALLVRDREGPPAA